MQYEKEYWKEYHDKNRIKLIQYHRKFNALPERREYMHNRYLKNKTKLAKYIKKSRKGNPMQWKKYDKKGNQRLKLKVLLIVGHGKVQCSNCGTKDFRILEINHLNGRTDDKTKYGNNSKGFYYDILKGRRSIKDLNVLCKVCNWAYFVEKKFGIKFRIEAI